MTFKKYRRLVKDQGSDWLIASYKNPSKYMRPVHLAIIKSVLIRRGRKGNLL
jgi:hypothetical protein